MDQALPSRRITRRHLLTVRLFAVALVTVLAGTAMSTHAFAASRAGILRSASTLATRRLPLPAIRLRMPKPLWTSPGRASHLSGAVAATTGPVTPRVEARGHRSRDSRVLANDIAVHLAAGNTEVARYVIPQQVHRGSGCRLAFLSVRIDPEEREAVRGERSARGRRLALMRKSLGRDAAAHAVQVDAAGLEVHVIVVQRCPDPGS